MSVHLETAESTRIPGVLPRVGLELRDPSKTEIDARFDSIENGVMAIMPCTWSVHELADGSVWVSHNNIGLMSKTIGGVFGRSMAGSQKRTKSFSIRCSDSSNSSGFHIPSFAW